MRWLLTCVIFTLLEIMPVPYVRAGLQGLDGVISDPDRRADLDAATVISGSTGLHMITVTRHPSPGTRHPAWRHTPGAQTPPVARKNTVGVCCVW